MSDRHILALAEYLSQEYPERATVNTKGKYIRCCRRRGEKTRRYFKPLVWKVEWDELWPGEKRHYIALAKKMLGIAGVT